MTSRGTCRLLPLPLLALALAAAACAHAPALRGAEATREGSGDGVVPRARPERVLATGSHLPRPVGRDGLPVTDAPLRVITRDALGQTGRPDVARALEKLEPAAQ